MYRAGRAWLTLDICVCRLASSASLPYRLIEGTPEVKTERAFRARENEDMTVDEDAIRDLLREL